MALKPFVFVLHRYRRNVLLLAPASACSRACVRGCACVPMRAYWGMMCTCYWKCSHAFEAHPRAAYAVVQLPSTPLFCLASEHISDAQKTEESARRPEKKVKEGGVGGEEKKNVIE